MASWTKADIIAKVLRDLDLEEESIITQTEIEGYLNEAIEDCEAIIHGLDEDYFLSRASLALVEGQSLYSLPDDIYASKIRGIIYRNGTERYPITRVRNYLEFETLDEIDNSDGAGEYRYILLNTDGETGAQIELHPPSRETSSTNVTVWFIREASRLTDDDDVCDIPEFINYIFAHMKKSCMAKESLGIAPPDAITALDKQEKRLVDTLTNRVPDNDSTVQLDLSHYWEHE